MTDVTTAPQEQNDQRPFLPLGSVVILKGSVKKLIVVSRASVVEDNFFDYGAAMYPEGMIDSKIAYFTRDAITKIVFEGYVDGDEDLAQEVLANAATTYRETLQQPLSVPAVTPSETVSSDDPFASVRDLEDSDD